MNTQKNILIIRSARDNVLAYAARLVRDRYPDARLAVLCQAEHRDRVTAVKPARVFIYPGADFNPAGLAGGLRGELAEEEFDEVVVLYHNCDGRGYEDVHALVRAFHRGPVAVIDSAGRYCPRRDLTLHRLVAGAAIVLGALAGAAAAVCTRRRNRA